MHKGVHDHRHHHQPRNDELHVGKTVDIRYLRTDELSEYHEIECHRDDRW